MNLEHQMADEHYLDRARQLERNRAALRIQWAFRQWRER